jgi:predicted Fe-Mo cluster-binding NifX family protein
MFNGRVAVPSVEKGGINGVRSGHFGHCDVFTLIDVEEGKIKNISIIKNETHAQGGCMVPVNLLEKHKVNALIVGGIGMRPLMGFRHAGIDVYYEPQESKIKPLVEDLIEGRLNLIRNNQVCGNAA